MQLTNCQILLLVVSVHIFKKGMQVILTTIVYNVSMRACPDHSRTP